MLLAKGGICWNWIANKLAFGIDSRPIVCLDKTVFCDDHENNANRKGNWIKEMCRTLESFEKIMSQYLFYWIPKYAGNIYNIAVCPLCLSWRR